MTFLEQMLAHRGGLIRFKRELVSHVGSGLERHDLGDQVFLLIDAVADGDWYSPVPVFARTGGTPVYGRAIIQVLLMGSPRWVAAIPIDVEILD